MGSLAGRTVKTSDDGFRIFCNRDLASQSWIAEKGGEVRLGGVSDFEGREWVEVILPDQSINFALGATVRGHTDIPIEVVDLPQELAPVSRDQASERGAAYELPIREYPPPKPLPEWGQWLVAAGYCGVLIVGVQMAKTLPSWIEGHDFSLYSILSYAAKALGALMLFIGLIMKNKALFAWGALVLSLGWALSFVK
jgi:hypothetical protein